MKLRDDATEEQIETVVDRADQYFADHDSRWVDWTVISVSIGLFSMNIDKTKTNPRNFSRVIGLPAATSLSVSRPNSTVSRSTS